jgi:catechol 2,3-dioxygenase-like lactoylglutathione lyase family enzyme
MEATRSGLGAVTLFVEDLDAVTAFYRDGLQLRLLFQDDVSAAFDLGGTVVNVLAARAAPPLVAPARTEPVGTTAQLLLSVWVEDVDAACAELEERGIALLNGPVDRPLGKRTAAFADPAGTVWEFAQDIPAA